MAKLNKKAEDDAKQNRSKRKQTVRERTQTSQSGTKHRIRKTAGRLSSPIKRVRQTGKREYHLPLPDNRVGSVLGKRVRLAPKFMREAWQEIKLVTWPNARETMRLTMAVFIFSVIFAAIVGALDFGLDKLFREVIVKK